MVPCFDILRLSDNWRTCRPRATDRRHGARPALRGCRHCARSQLPELKFDDIVFTDVIDFLRDISSSNIVVI